jgi:hypothetical protein
MVVVSWVMMRLMMVTVVIGVVAIVLLSIRVFESL